MIPIKYGVVLTFFLFIGFLLRIYNINNNPPELFADEIANSLSALSILKTGKDVNSRLLPYFFYEVELISPIYGYISAPFVLIFGKSALAVRLPAVLLGTASIFFIYKLIYLITNDLNVSICSALILSLLPWHIHYSRIGWQPALEVPLMIISIHFFLKYVKLFKNKYLFLSILFFVTFFYSSRASEFFSPALLFLLVVININKFKINKKNLILLILFYFILLTPFFYTLITQTHLYVRAKRIFTFNNGITYNSLSVFFRNYFSHFSSSFLFIKGDSNLRYSPGSHGLLYWWLLPFVIIGIFISILKFKDNNYKFLTICLFFYPLGGSLTNDECPRATRSMIGVIIFCFFASLGIVSLFKLLNKFYKREFFYLFFLILINAIVVEFLFFCHVYFNKYPYISAYEWEYGNKKMFDWILENSDFINYLCINTSRSRYVYRAFYLFDKKIDFVDNLSNPLCYRKSAVIVISNDQSPREEWQLRTDIRDLNNNLVFSIYQAE